MPCAVCGLLAIGAPTADAMLGPLSGWTDLAEGRWQAAQERFAADHAADPADWRAAIGLAALQELQGDTASAAKILASGLSRASADPFAAGVLAHLAQLAPRLPDGGASLLPVIEPLARGTRPAPHPEAAALALDAAVEILRQDGRGDDALALLRARAGQLTRWTVLGPYGRFERLALWQTQPPERDDLDPSDDPIGAAGVRPFAVELNPADGRLVIPLSMHSVGVVYAAGRFETPTRGWYRVRAASPVSFRLWIDGKERVTADRIGARPATALATTLELPAGPHTVLVKLANGSRFAWFTLGVTASAASNETATIDASPDVSRLDDPAAALAAAWWLRARGLDREAGSVLEALATRWPDSPLWVALWGLHLRDAQTGSAAEEDFAQARGLLERAVQASPGWSRPRLWIAEMDAGAGRTQDAWEATSKLLTAAPEDVDAARLAARLALGRGWNVEARGWLERARRSAPGRIDLLSDAVELYGRIGAPDAQRAALAEWGRRAPEQDDWIDRLSADAAFSFDGSPAARARVEAALAAWDRLLALRPGHLYAALAKARLLADVGREVEGLALLDAWAARYPYEAVIELRRAGLLAQRGDDQSAERALRRSLELDRSQIEIGETLIRRGEPDPLAQYLADGAAILASAPPPAEGVDSALLADISAVEIDREGGQTELYQGIHKVYTRAGVEREGELQPLPRARIEALRLHKPDGRVVDVEPNHRPLNLPQLGPGDAIEYVWRRYTPPLEPIPGALDNSTVWLFQNDDRAYVLSRYVVIHDQDLPVAACGNTGGIEVTDRIEQGHRIRDHIGRALPVLRLEPHVADREEITPHIRLALGADWQDYGDLVRSALQGALMIDAPLPAMVEQVRKQAGGQDPRRLARAIHEVVTRGLRPGQQSLSLGLPASVNASAGEGNRTTVALALARAFALDARLILARTHDRNGIDLDCPLPAIFHYPLAAIVVDQQPLLMDFNEGDHPFDTIPPAYSGADALEVPLDPARPAGIVTLPVRSAPLLRQTHAQLVLSPEGEVEGTVQYTFRGSYGSFVRRLLRELPAERLELMFQSLAAEPFPGALLRGRQVQGDDDPAADLILTLTIAHGRFARATTDGLALPIVTDPTGLLQEFASLPIRRYALRLDAEVYRLDEIELTPPPGWSFGPLPERTALESPFGRLLLDATRRGEALIVRREVTIPLRRVEPVDYQDLREFAQAIDTAERRELTIGR